MKIMAIGAHPDDIEIGCAGTLARCTQRGDKVTMVVVCRGEMGSGSLPVKKLLKIRSQEARQSSRLIRAELVELGRADGHAEINHANLNLFTDIIRQIAPDCIITHYHADYSLDHNNTLTLTRDASLYATVPHVRTHHPPLRNIPFLYMMEPLGGYNFQPEVFVDISATFATKLDMLACHKSQIAWMSRYNGMDFRKYIEVVARFRGYQSQVEFAEGFVAHKSWAHIPARPILP